MKISFPYPGYEEIRPVEVSVANLLGVFAPQAVGEIDEELVLDRGFAEPFGAWRLCHEVKPTDRVLILIDDLTRGTPVPRLLKRVIAELWEAGVLDRQIQLLTAQGSHREMTDKELALKLRRKH